jgi:3-deoxy-D-manno-octulosonate 8-phosphate phosphatase (KDO 8-P phosphatase)
MANDGEFLKAFDIKDGCAINEILPQNKIIPVWITGRQSEIVANRAKELHVDLVYQNIKDKLPLLKEIAAQHGITLDQIAYIGDDINDLECIKNVSYSGCPADAAREIKEVAAYITKSKAGAGAIREFVEWILK